MEDLKMKVQAATFLMFQDGRAEEAMNFYVSLFENSEVTGIERYAAGAPGPEGSVKRADFILGGHRLICSDSFVKHDFSFTPSISIFVECESEPQIDEIFSQLSAGGQVFMPLDNYGFSTKFGWTGDRFGVSWQLNLQ
jgi:predicted 3-demethylubiquinone-9 3-methyltransferase (glyoxalase superfamily)